MNVLVAAYHTVHQYKGGASALAPLVLMNPAVLRSKVDLNVSTHHLRLDESVTIQSVTGDHRICRAMNEELGYLPPIPRVEAGVSDLALLETYTKLMSELGEFSQKFHKALADGRLTMAEVDGLQAEMNEFFAAGAELLNRAREIAER